MYVSMYVRMYVHIDFFIFKVAHQTKQASEEIRKRVSYITNKLILDMPTHVCTTLKVKDKHITTQEAL